MPKRGGAQTQRIITPWKCKQGMDCIKGENAPAPYQAIITIPHEGNLLTQALLR